MKIAITGGIACGKSLVAKFLNELGVKTIDADDIVHEIIPLSERQRLAKIVFNDPDARKKLEDKIHPLVKARIDEFILQETGLCVAIIPLLFEVHWENNFDIICCVTSDRENQILRMMTKRGYTHDEAEARIAAQMPVMEKVNKSQYVITNDGSSDELEQKVVAFVEWLRNK